MALAQSDQEQQKDASVPEAPKENDQSLSVNAPSQNDVPAVRFSSAVEEINPGPTPLTSPPEEPAQSQEQEPQPSDSVSAEDLKDVTRSLQTLPLQERRINTYHFEPFSLPPSRVPSRDEDSPGHSTLPTPSSAQFPQSPHGSPRLSAMASPPLTPAGSALSPEKEKMKPSLQVAPVDDYQSITPQPSSSNEKSPSLGQRVPLAHRPASSDQIFKRSASAEERHQELTSHRRGLMGRPAGSVPVSRESSPSRISASNFYSKPMTPGGDANDPYAKGRRPPQQSGRHSIDPRFIFTKKKKQHGPSPSSSKMSLTEKRSSGIFGKSTSDDTASERGVPTTQHHGHGHHQHGGHGSMADLKRFFKKGGSHKKRESKQVATPYSSTNGLNTPPGARSSTQLPFGDDHGLSSKYGKIGKVLGSGAGGSVRLMKRKDDGTVFAVKEFRARHTYESEKEYNKKVTAEFCVGSTLHHGNIIETLDILHEKGRWYEVMEYAPFDLFAIVMTGKMSREEITCCFLQILNGLTYLHSLGLAHRDLKLDNVVVSDKGIMKIIDFGSAHVFKYPFETDAVPAKGIVGSDPYLAPEVYESKEYDAPPVDIWSLAIIFCCMTLRRFPWKLPRMTDNSFKLFASEPTPDHDPAALVYKSKRSAELLMMSPKPGDHESQHYSDQHHHDSHSHHHKRGESTATKAPEPEKVEKTEKPEKTDNAEPAENSEKTEKSAKPEKTEKAETSSSQSQQPPGEKKEVIRGPWRILRLLPRESRHIIWRMLEMDPKKRATMDEILAEPWVADTIICQQLDSGEVIPACDHEHVLEPPSAQPQPKP
ncbi:unnamed protein product [Clonostachys rosea f. rosea IK726]|uniref:non-specific serine/threonine protein kinase n=2 Tax=Bionectria ochroleuca TaxID=29856 RepID=A0A0B7JNR7_BIOOC|nr:unnamed protein product [Clonostachys rosea f. rosea IK726]